MKKRKAEYAVYPHRKRVVRIEVCLFEQQDGSYSKPVEMGRVNELRTIYCNSEDPEQRPYVRIGNEIFYLQSLSVPIYRVEYKQPHLYVDQPDNAVMVA
jgi:hypothetical protein